MLLSQTDHKEKLLHHCAMISCLVGFFLYVAFSDPLLNALGFHYSGGSGSFYEKLHPGCYLIFLSFVFLLWIDNNPIKKSIELIHQQTSFVFLACLTIFIFIYIVLRSGFAGTAFLFDTHLVVPTAAISLSQASAPTARRLLGMFIGLAFLNSLIGLGEAFTTGRIIAFDQDWSVLHEEYFRASALRGHPLVNALFTVIALFTTIALPLARSVKVVIGAVLLASLIAFGSRAALVICMLGLFVLGVISFIRDLRQPTTSLSKTIKLIFLSIIVPLGLIGIFFLLQYAGIGERLASTLQWDESANSRLLAFQAIEHLSPEEIILGVSGQKILSITSDMNTTEKLGGIENPWLLLFMFQGAILFFIWLTATAVFLYTLFRNQSAALKCAVISFLLIATSYNSFGTKDANYLIMVCAVICASKVIEAKASVQQTVSDIPNRHGRM